MSVPRRSTIVCDAGGISAPDVGTINVLARLQLGALRHGFELRLRNAPAELVELIALIGLGDVLCVELKREAENREERLRVEEEGELDDPAGL
jgi:ABC-type transporter Mla MlaB component